MPIACMASEKHRWKCSMPPAENVSPTSTPPSPLRASATGIAPGIAPDTATTFAGLPNPKSTSYTRNLGDPTTNIMPAFAASITLLPHPSHLSGYPSLTTSSSAFAIAVNAAKRPPVPAAVSSSWRVTAMAGMLQLPKYVAGRGGFNRAR
ncbi:hypothetical protein VPH35_101963 [Triticum aestivum]